jgi:hypothetical protein
MPREVEIRTKAGKDLRKTPKDDGERITRAILNLGAGSTVIASGSQISRRSIVCALGIGVCSWKSSRTKSRSSVSCTAVKRIALKP